MPVVRRAVAVCQPEPLPGYRLSKHSLVRKSWEFDGIYSQGKRLHGKGFTLVCRANTEGCSRIGISVHGKIKGAVNRNRIKRIIRESFRLQRDLYPPGADIVFAVKPGFALLSPSAVSQAVAFVTRQGRNHEV